MTRSLSTRYVEKLVKLGFTPKQVFDMPKKCVFATYINNDKIYSDLFCLMRELWPKQVEEIEAEVDEYVMKLIQPSYDGLLDSVIEETERRL